MADTHHFTPPRPSFTSVIPAQEATELQNRLPRGKRQTSLCRSTSGADPLKRSHERSGHEKSVHVKPRWQCEQSVLEINQFITYIRIPHSHNVVLNPLFFSLLAHGFFVLVPGVFFGGKASKKVLVRQGEGSGGKGRQQII